MNVQRSLDRNYNRRTTRDLLLEYDAVIMPPYARAAGLPLSYPWLNDENQESYEIPTIPDTPEFQTVYPWESVGLNILGDQLYLLAFRSGYFGTREDFHRYFGEYLKVKKQEIIFDYFENFPTVGRVDKLYFDSGEKILYYWDGEYKPVNLLSLTNALLEDA